MCCKLQWFIQLWAHDLRTGDKHPAYTPHGTLYLQSFTLLANNHSLHTCTTHCHTTDCTWRAGRSKCIGVSEKKFTGAKKYNTMKSYTLPCIVHYIYNAKNEWWVAGVVICLERGTDLHMAQLMPLPLTVSCFSKI